MLEVLLVFVVLCYFCLNWRHNTAIAIVYQCQPLCTSYMGNSCTRHLHVCILFEAVLLIYMYRADIWSTSSLNVNIIWGLSRAVAVNLRSNLAIAHGFYENWTYIHKTCAHTKINKLRTHKQWQVYERKVSGGNWVADEQVWHEVYWSWLEFVSRW